MTTITVRTRRFWRRWGLLMGTVMVDMGRMNGVRRLLRKIDKLTREVEGLRKNFNRKTQKKTDETSPTKKTARAAAAAAPDGSRMCDDPHHDADLGHTDPNTFGTKRRKIATRQPRTTTTATATGVRLDITDPADRDRIPADGPDPAGDPA